jgi:hypothetical protein
VSPKFYFARRVLALAKANYERVIFRCWLLQVAMTKHFMYLPYERLMCILGSDLLNIECEIEIFCAVVAWIDYDRMARLCYAPSLLKCAVRMHCISPEQLIMKCETIDWLFDNPDCEYILNEAIRYVMQDHFGKAPFEINKT